MYRTCHFAELLHVVLDFCFGRRLDGLEGECPQQEVAHHEHADPDLAEDEGHEGPEEVLEPLPRGLLGAGRRWRAGWDAPPRAKLEPVPVSGRRRLGVACGYGESHRLLEEGGSSLTSRKQRGGRRQIVPT